MKKQTIILFIVAVLLLSLPGSIFADDHETTEQEQTASSSVTSVAKIAATSSLPVPPPEPQCSTGDLLWQQDITVDALGVVTVSEVRFVGDGRPDGITIYEIPTPLPAEFGSAVEVTVADAVAWDGYVRRVNVSQPNERFRVLFLKDGAIVWASDWTGDPADNVASAFWQGPIGGPITLSEGADQILLVHWGDLDYGTGDQTNPNSVVPSSVCIDYKPLVSSIGDTVFEDTNVNGVQDAGEPGIPGVTVDLTCAGPDGALGTGDDITATDVTDANGTYLFEGLPAGMCQVNPDETTVPAGYELTTNNDPQMVDLGAGEAFLDADFGYTPPRYTLGDRVWYDQNQDGVQDANEPSYPNGIDVALYADATCAGTPIATISTDGNGRYQFTDLLAGSYSVGFSGIPAGWRISPADQGTDGAADSDANAAGCIADISLTADDPTQDLGIFVSGSLGDSVVCASTGAGVANVTVTLFADFDGDGVADGPALATMETDTNGFYQFSGLAVALAGDAANTTAYVVAVDGNDADLGACNLPAGPTVYNPQLDSDMPADPDNDFFFEKQMVKNPGTGTPGYWKNHPEAWPVDQIIIGGVTYTKYQAIHLMSQPDRGHKANTIFRALVSAKLNVLIGNDSSCVADEITAADQWLVDNPVQGSKVKANSRAWQNGGEYLYQTLDAYNNGLLCAPSRG